MDRDAKILVTGASGMIGSALVKLLREKGFEKLHTPSHEQVDLTDQEDTDLYFFRSEFNYVFHLAAHVGGIEDNTNNPARFCYENTLMHCNVFAAIKRNCESTIKKLLFPGSACAYPRDAEQPIKESAFLTGIPEPTNLAYAVAKINGIVMAQSYAKQYGMKVVLPMVANTYGDNDRSSHVIPDMFRRFRNAKDNVILWGGGKPLREFIHADDVADALLFLMENYDSPEIINVGTGVEYSISALAHNIAHVLNYTGTIGFDGTKPDGAPRKVLDSSKLYTMGWKPKISLDEGLARIAA